MKCGASDVGVMSYASYDSSCAAKLRSAVWVCSCRRVLYCVCAVALLACCALCYVLRVAYCVVCYCAL